MPSRPALACSDWGACAMRAGLYGLSLLCEEMPVTLFRLGECLTALGEGEQARRVFEELIESCRGRDEYRGLQDSAAHCLSTL